MELPKAYAFAQEHGLPLPSGMVAQRAGSQMLGSFQYVNRTALGNDPALLVVLSVEGQTAQIIMSAKGTFNPKLGKMEGGSVWRFVTANVAGMRLEFVPREEGARMYFSWSDANSGTFSSLSAEGFNGPNKGLGGSTKFTRLDG